MVYERFCAWYERAPAAERKAALIDLVAHYGDLEFSEETAEEKRALERIFALVLTEADVGVRAAFAEAIALCERAPAALLWNLMQDVPQVAAPVFEHGVTLCERTLLAALSEGEGAVRRAIARRAILPASVVEAIVDCGDAAAIAALLDNDTLLIGPILLHDIAKAHGGDADIRERLMAREDLSLKTRQMLVKGLADALGTWAESMGFSTTSRPMQAARDAVNRASVDMAMEAPRGDMPAYVAHLRTSKQLTPALILRAICAGHTAFFEAALANLSGLSLERVQAIVDAGGGSAFRTLYGKCALPSAAQPVFIAAIKVWQKVSASSALGSMGDLDIYEAALDEIIAEVTGIAQVDPSMLAMLHRMAGEIARDRAAIARDLKLLEAA